MVIYASLSSVEYLDSLNKEVIANPKSIKKKKILKLSGLYVQGWHKSSLLKFRLSNRLLPVETGRWENTPLEDRKCTLCLIAKNDIGDEFHYLFCF